MAPSTAAHTRSTVTSRKRKAESHGLLEMCLTSGRRAVLSCLWAAKLLQSPERLRSVGGEVPWSGFNLLQHIYLHRAVTAAAKASDAAAGSTAAANPAREALIADSGQPPRGAQDPTDMIDLTLSDDSDATGRATPERADRRDASAASTSSQPSAFPQPAAPHTTAPAPASLSLGTSEQVPCSSRGGGRGRGMPAALLTARAGTPLLTALRARRPQPKLSACIATTPAGPSTNLQPLTAEDLGRLLRVEGWLNDEVVNFYMLLILKRDAESRRRPATDTAAATAPQPAPAAPSPSRISLGQTSDSLIASRAGRAPAAAAAARQQRSFSAARVESDTAVGSRGMEKLQEADVLKLTALVKKASLQETVGLWAAAAPAPASPLKQVVSAVATAAAAAAVAAAATTAAGLGAVVAAGAKHLAQRRPRRHGHATAAAEALAAAAPPVVAGPAAASSVPAAVPSEPSSSGPSSVSSPALGLLAPLSQQPCTAFAFNSFFFSKLTGKGNRKCFAYGDVRRWTLPCRTYTADCVLTRDLLLFPINHGNTHWCLAAVWPRRRLLQYYDSLGGTRTTADWVLETLFQWLQADAKDKGVTLGSADPMAAAAPARTAAGATPEAAGWRRESSELRIPKQLDGCSCGVFVCAFAELLARGVTPHAFGFSQADIPSMRRGMAEQILRGAL